MDTTQAPADRAGRRSRRAWHRAAFAAGCFWGVEEFFRAIPGVVDAVSGYEGGFVDQPDLRAGVLGNDRARRGGAGHLRPSRGVLSTELLEEFWRHHDPTTLNRQGPDRGTQYRSAVFTHNDEQERRPRSRSSSSRPGSSAPSSPR